MGTCLPGGVAGARLGLRPSQLGLLAGGALLWTALGCFTLIGAELTPPAIEQQVLDFDRARIDAVVQRDFPRLEGMLAERLVFVHSGKAGILPSRAVYLEQTKADQKFSATGFTVKNPVVRIHGRVAVVAGAVTYFGARQVGTIPVRDGGITVLYLAVYHRTADSWELVAFQGSPLSPTVPATPPPQPAAQIPPSGIVPPR